MRSLLHSQDYTLTSVDPSGEPPTPIPSRTRPVPLLLGSIKHPWRMSQFCRELHVLSHVVLSLFHALILSSQPE